MKVLKHVKPCMRQAGVMTHQVISRTGAVRTIDLENGSSENELVKIRSQSILGL